MMVDSWIGFRCKGRVFDDSAVGGKDRAGEDVVNRKGGFLHAMFARYGVKVNADVGVSKTSATDSEAGNDDFVTTEGLV